MGGGGSYLFDVLRPPPPTPGCSRTSFNATTETTSPSRRHSPLLLSLYQSVNPNCLQFKVKKKKSSTAGATFITFYESTLGEKKVLRSVINGSNAAARLNEAVIDAGWFGGYAGYPAGSRRKRHFNCPLSSLNSLPNEPRLPPTLVF